MEEKEILRSLETLNRQFITLRESRAYTSGVKIMRLKTELKQKKFTLQFIRMKKRRLLKKVRSTGFKDNQSESDWEENVRLGDPTKRVVIYSCITGGYDIPKRPLYYPKNAEYIMFISGFEGQKLPIGWNYCDIPEKIAELGNNTLINRYIKFHPHELFAGKYDYSIYLDGNITVVSDLTLFADFTPIEYGIAMHKHCSRTCITEEVKACIALGKGNPDKMKKQVRLYKDNGFPDDYGMLECNVIVTDLTCENARGIFEMWWDEVLQSGSGRDQLALPYVLWSKGIRIDEIAKLGSNCYRNYKIQFADHL